MASPERPTNLSGAQAAIRHQLEVADEIENPIERFFKREKLLEQYDELQAEAETTVSANEEPSARQDTDTPSEGVESRKQVN